MTKQAEQLHLFKMVIRTYFPKSPLSEFVELFWYSERGAPQHAKERCLPTGTMELVINLREDQNRIYDRLDHNRFESYSGALICGAHSNYFIIDSAPQDEIIGVHFKPGGAYPFLNLPVDELHNTHLSLDELWGSEAGELHEQLLETATLDGSSHSRTSPSQTGYPLPCTTSGGRLCAQTISSPAAYSHHRRYCRTNRL